MNPNQLVAARLKLARTSRRWSQQDAIDALARHGVHWSIPVYSAAERAVSGTRTRQFDADLLVTFSRVFGFPVSWFFTPLPRDEYGLLPEITARPGRPDFTADELVDALIRNYGAWGYALLAADLSPHTRARIARLHSQAEFEAEPEPPDLEGAT